MKRPKYFLFTLIALMTVVVIHMDRVLLDPQSAIWKHYESFKWWLLPHGVTGALALLLGPFQFSRRLRQRRLRCHRWMGRVYVCGVAVASPIGIVIEAIKYAHGVAPLRLLIGSIGFGILFAGTTGVGFSLAMRAQVQQHQMWMVRSYAIATVFLQVRCVDQLPWLGKVLQWPMEVLETHFISGLWLHIAFSMIAAEMLLKYEEIRRKGAKAGLEPSPRTGTATA